MIFKHSDYAESLSFRKLLKVNLERLSGLGLLLIINALIFLFHNNLFLDYLTLNLFGFTPHDAFFSISLTRFILNLGIIFNLEISGLIVMGIFLIPGIVYLFYRYFTKWNIERQLPEIYCIAILFIFLVYLDIWFSCLIFLAPFMSLFIIRLKVQINGKENPHIVLDNFSMKDYKPIFYCYILLSLNLWLLVPLTIKLIIIPGLNITNFIYLAFTLAITIFMIRKL